MKLVDFLTALEQSSQRPPDGKPAGTARMGFKMGPLEARCARCDSIEFAAVDASAPLGYTTRIACAACGEQAVVGNLVVQVAKDAVQQSRAMTAARMRRQAELLQRSPKLRAMREAAVAPVVPKDPTKDPAT
jgi:hypothetical protein